MGNAWLKLTIFAFVGILISVVLLGMASSSGFASVGNSHTQHTQASTNMSGMNLQDMYTSNNMQMNSMSTNNDMYRMQQQMMQMQYQLNMMQQQMNMMNSQNRSNMQQSSGSMGGMM